MEKYLYIFKNKILEVQKSFFADIFLNPAIPLAVYFCMSTLFFLLAEYSTIHHPAYWVFGYLAVCLIQAGIQEGRMIARWRMFDFIDFIFVAFVLVLLFSWAATGRTGGNRMIAFVLSSMMIPWITARLLTPSQIGDFIRYTAVFGSAIAVSYWAVVPLLQESDVIYERVMLFGKYAAYGILGPTVGLLAVMSAVYLMLPRTVKSERVNWAAWLMLPLSIVVIMHMGGRGMFISAVFALLFGCAFVRKSPWQRKTAVLLVVLVSFIVGLIIVPKARLGHFDNLLETQNALATLEQPDRLVDDTVSIRMELYREAIDIFLSKPVTGSGTGRFGLESSYFGRSFPLTTPHSTILHVLAELGIFGALPFIILNLMLLSIAWRVVRAQLSDSTMRLACVVAVAWIYIVIYDQISANYFSSLRYYLFSALLISLYLASRDEKIFAHVPAPVVFP